jgi:hypothetical protein
MERKFDVDSLLGLQALVFPLVKMLGGPDLPALIAGGADTLPLFEDALRQVADVFGAAHAGEHDGVLTRPEVDAVIKETQDVKLAVVALLANLKPGSQPAQPQ